MATLAASSSLVNALVAKPIVHSEPQIEAAAASLFVKDLSPAFLDRKVYEDVALDYFSKETSWIMNLQESLLQGEDFLSLVYAYRSCSKAIPQVQSQVQANKNQLYIKTYEILRPQIQKMKELMSFCDSSVATFCEVIGHLVNEYRSDNYATTELLICMARTLDMFVVIDALKNMKASLNNDFSMYKRALSNIIKENSSTEDETVENHKLYLFLGNHDRFSAKLKEELQKVTGYEDVLVEVVNAAVDRYEKAQYLDSQTKHMLLKATAFGLALIDGPQEEKDITRKKKIKLDRFGRVFRAMPVVPLFGDMTITLSQLYSKAPHLANRWDPPVEDETIKYYSTLHNIELTRLEYNDYLSRLRYVLNDLDTNVLPSKRSEASTELCSQVYALLLEGLRFLAKWTSKILEQSAWKLAHPTNNTINPECPAEATNYEMAVRFNYTSEERFALAEYIAMIKSLHATLDNLEAGVLDCVRKHIYIDVQNFMKITLESLVAQTTKKKRAIASALKTLHDMTTDFMNGSGGENQSIFRVVGPAATQIYFVRVLLEHSCNEKAKGMQGGFMKDKDFKDAQVEEIMKFVDNSFYYEFMINYKESLSKCSDLSELWYKEFYLELSKQIQFPIEMSLPWILTNHILESNAPDLTESILFPLSIYNDAANKALYKLKTRFIYDEIEAEANLSFDQFIFKYSEKIFLHFKLRASSLLLSENAKAKFQSATNVTDTRYDAPFNRHESILKQKRFQFLGRSIDIGRVVTQMINQYLRKSIEVAISRYEASEFTYVIELESLLKNAKLTHQLLSEYLDLDPFDDIMAEVNESTSLVAFNGRITSHTIGEFTTDFMSNYCYNSVTERFLPTPMSLVDERQRPNFPKVPPIYLYGSRHLFVAHNVHSNLFRGFVGAPHFAALVRIVGKENISVIVSEIVKCLDQLIRNVASPYIWALGKGFPPNLKLPALDYGTKGTYEYFQAILKPLLSYKDRVQVYQVFREIGNGLLVVKALEDAMTTGDVLAVLTSFPRTKDSASVFETPVPVTAETVTAKAVETLQVPDPVMENERIQLLQQPNRISLMPTVIERLTAIVQECVSLWGGESAESPTAATTDDPFNQEGSKEFHRIWSFIQFSYCLPSNFTTEFSSRELFGESVIWGGATFLLVLRQIERFKAFDFTFHFCYVSSIDPIQSIPTKQNSRGGTDKDRELIQEMKMVLDLGEFYKSVHEEIFGYFREVLGEDNYWKRNIASIEAPSTLPQPASTAKFIV